MQLQLAALHFSCSSSIQEFFIHHVIIVAKVIGKVFHSAFMVLFFCILLEMNI